MKRLLATSMVLASACLFGNAAESEEHNDVICNELVEISYEADSSKCSIDEESAPCPTEKEKSLIELDPYKAKGKVLVNNERKRKLQIWVGRTF